ncbi:MAG TPA: cation diffusion facilitator family transporter [Burkholderiales bacterium]|nr:cation diffusion facilitator family transporter [Burkholderiales bacterium]
MSDLLDRSNPQRYRAGMRVTLVSIATNILLSAAQIIIGVIGQSQALVADGLHTLSDLLTDFFVLFALKHGHREADEEHPYGHARIETAVTLLLGIVLVAVGIGIAVSAGIKLARAQAFVSPSVTTLWVALGTLLAKEVLYHYTMRTARAFGSDMLRANAWHHRSDAVSSLIVVVGIGGTLLGFSYLDSIAAIIVALMIIKIGVELAWGALRELIDTGLSHQDLEALRKTILSVDGVKALHLLRTRNVGEQALADVHLIVDDRLSVSEGHRIGEAVRTKLMQDFAVTDVTVHIDTEEDEQRVPGENPPLRDEVLRRLQDYFAGIPEARRIERTTLHYGNGRIVVELVLPFSTVPDSARALALSARFNAAVAADTDIKSISLLFR